MDCGEVRLRLSGHLDGELDGSTRARVEQHLADCRACARDLRELRSAIALLGSLSEPDPPMGFAERVVARVGVGVSRSARLRRAWRGGLAAAAVLAALLLAGAPALRERLGREEPAGSEARSRSGPARPATGTRGGEPAYFRGAEAPALGSDLDRELELALERPGDFADRVRELPEGDRERLLASLAQRAASRGDAQAVARRLAGSGDPFTRSLAPPFERPPPR